MLSIRLNQALALFLIALMFVSCSPLTSTGPGAPRKNVLLSTSARAIDEHLESIRGFLDEDMPELASMGQLSGEEVARRALGEENGQKYLEFCYYTYTDSFESTEDVLAAADGLIGKEEIDKIRSEGEEFERILREYYEPEMRKLSSSQQEAFNKDLRKLVTKAVVLLTASVVYALIPNYIFWGKISAAIALAVAAGVLSMTLMSIIDYYKSEKKGNSNLSMAEWLKEVTTEPAAASAMATGIIATGKAVSRTPFATAVILATFSVFNILDDAKAILKNYNFKV